MQIVDPRLASYGVENPLYAIIQLAQTTMRSELGKITLDKTFEERDTLNEKIVVSIIGLGLSSTYLLFDALGLWIIAWIDWLFLRRPNQKYNPEGNY